VPEVLIEAYRLEAGNYRPDNTQPAFCNIDRSNVDGYRLITAIVQVLSNARNLGSAAPAIVRIGCFLYGYLISRLSVRRDKPARRRRWKSSTLKG
jgi:hypothetical protein